MPFAQLVGIEHVEAFVGDAEVVEDLHHLARKTRNAETAACPS